MDEATTEAATGRYSPDFGPALEAKKPSYKEETIARVLKYFENNPTKSISRAAEALGLSKGSINEIRSYLIRTQKLSRLIKPPKEGT